MLRKITPIVSILNLIVFSVLALSIYSNHRANAQAGVDTTGKTAYNSIDLFGSLITLAAGTKYAYPVHFVSGVCTLGTSCSITLAGNAAFTGTTTYHCAGADQTSAAAIKIVNTSATQVDITGTSTDVIGYVCAGN